MPNTILVIDDEASICFAFRRFFEKRGYRVLIAGNAAEARSLASSQCPGLTFLDLKLGNDNGLDILSELHGNIIVMTAFGSLDKVKKAFEAGARDYLTKPLDMNTVERLVQQAFHTDGYSRQSVPAVSPVEGFIGSSIVMQNLLKKLLKVAALDDSVLICGPTGTGKELAARLIHSQSPQRKDGPFVAVNCGAIPENLIESELFGHCKGAFTGALSDRTGHCEAADKGVLFLDEIGELSLTAQVKLLRFLDSRTIEKVGETTPKKIDVRIIAATNRNLQQAVANGTFREDLYYRLAVLTIETPSLEQHREDIPELARHFLQVSASGLMLSDDAADALLHRPWPGNVRQLRNTVVQAALEAQGNFLTPDCLPPAMIPADSLSSLSEDHLRQYAASLPLNDDTLKRATDDIQKCLIERAIEACNGNQSQAAALLGIHRNSLHRLMNS